MSDVDLDFSISETTDGDVHVVAVAGQADLHTASDLRAAIATTIGAGAANVVVDLSETTFIDSMALGVLLGALKRLAPLEGRIAIACPNASLRRIFEITSLDRVLDVTATRDEAIARVRHPTS